MDENTIICAECFGVIKTLYKRFDEKKQKTYFDWDYKGLESDDIYFTETEAIEIARSYKADTRHLKNIQVIQPLVNDEYLIIDYTKDKIEYHLKKAPTV